MGNKIFLDSSILVEWAKKTKPELFNHLRVGQYDLFISQITLSEFMYYWLAISSSKATVTLKRAGAIPATLHEYNPISLLNKFIWLDADKRIITLDLELMQQYNLLPNDALILATCKLNGITKIASYNADFEPAYQGEGIQLIRQVSELI